MSSARPITAPRPRAALAAPRRRRRSGLAIVVLLLVLAGAAAYTALLARDVWSETMAGRAAFTQGLSALTSGPVTDLSTQRLDAAAGDFRRASAAFARARARLGLWGDLATSHGALLPGPARQARSAAPLLDFARRAAGAATTLCAGLRPLAAVLQQHGTGAAQGDVLVRLTAALEQAGPALARAQRQLRAAETARMRLAGLPLPAGVAALLAAFDRRAPQALRALGYARDLPALLGAAGPRSYLLVYQDTADLRATGGFIGAASLLILRQGRLTQTDYEDITQLQLPFTSASVAPPLPLFYYEQFSSFQLRDANFWPDFPTSAVHIAQLYQRASGRRLDGVVAVEPGLLSYLLRGTGPLAVPAFHETVTAANVVARMEYYTHEQPGVAGNRHRKRFIVALSQAVIGALQRAGSARLGAVLPQLVRALDDRLALISLDDPYVAGALRRARWDGSLRGDRGDYLAVFDQNMSDSKLNPFVDQQISYTARRRADGGLDSSVSISYHNRTRHTALWIARTSYQNYLRVIVPGHSRLLSQSGYDDTFWPGDVESGRQVIPGYVLIPGGGTRSVTTRYTVPASALAGVRGYRLVVQKQPGSRPAVLSVRVSAGGRTWTARTVLARDAVFSTPWTAPSGALHMGSGAPTVASAGGL